MNKMLHDSEAIGTFCKMPDVRLIGDGDLFQLLYRESSEIEGWKRSAKAMQCPNGCVVQVTTQQRNEDGSYSIAEALTYVPGPLDILDDVNGGRRLGYA